MVVKEDNFVHKGVACYIRVEERGDPETGETVYIWRAEVEDSPRQMIQESMGSFSTLEEALADGKTAAVQNADLIAP